MILFLDTSDFEQIELALIGSGKVIKKIVPVSHNDSEKTLPALQDFLRKNKVLPSAMLAKRDKIAAVIEKIYLVSGPGSFTGIRVGAAISLALGFAWNIPVLAIKKERLPKKLSDLPKIRAKKIGADFEPDYGTAPKITKEKKKVLRNT